MQNKIDVYSFTLEELQEADQDMNGFCIFCGEEAYNVEPDARKYTCESCNQNGVYGAQELVLMGNVKE